MLDYQTASFSSVAAAIPSSSGTEYLVEFDYSERFKPRDTYISLINEAALKFRVKFGQNDHGNDIMVMCLQSVSDADFPNPSTVEYSSDFTDPTMVNFINQNCYKFRRDPTQARVKSVEFEKNVIDTLYGGKRGGIYQPPQKEDDKQFARLPQEKKRRRHRRRKRRRKRFNLGFSP